jgi:ATP-dependent protease HslVU (ClpYQ) peptidase subunit
MDPMSVLVAVKVGRRLVMAGDGLTTSGSHRLPPENHSVRKIKKVGQTLIGAAGWTMYANILDDFLGGSRLPVMRDEAAVLRFFVRFWRALKDRYTYVNDQALEDKTPFADLDAAFLVGNRHGIFQISSDMSILRCEQFMAIGSGADYALGALDQLYGKGKDPHAIAKAAVATAIRYHTGCGEPISSEDLRW